MPDAAAPSPQPQSPWPIDAPTVIDNLDSTVADADLFNKMARVVIVTADVQDYWQRWRQVKDPAHNPRARAPEHVQLVNNLSAADHTQHAHETHLGTVTDWDKLSTHMHHVAAPLTRCCFQCGMLNYPTPGDTIRVANITRKEDCRAFRVFRYYIRELVSGERDRLRACGQASEGGIKEEARANVFLCERSTGKTQSYLSSEYSYYFQVHAERAAAS